VAETIQSLSTVAETPNVVVAGLACATADVEVRPSTTNPRQAESSVVFKGFENFMTLTPDTTSVRD
jgi:hypothetical protein